MEVRSYRGSSSSDMDSMDFGRKRGSTIEVRKFSFGGGASQRKSGSGGQMLKMAAMSLGQGAVVTKELDLNPQMVVVSREKEKLALQELNDRFAAYIERVRFLEADNKRLQGMLAALTVKFDELDAALRAIYEAELAAARRTIDETTAAKAAVELKVAGLEASFAEISSLYQAELAAHIITRENVPKLEKMISERDAQIDFLTKNVSAMESELMRIKAQQGSLQTDLAVAKQAADAETVARVELESLVQTRDDELLFVKSMYEEKVRALLSFDVGSDMFAQAFSNELALALRDIRAEYEAIAEATRSTDTDAWYKAKFNEVMAVTQRQTGDLGAAKEEVRSWRTKYHALNGDYSSMRGMIGGLEEQIRVLQTDMATAEASYNQTLGERDARIHALNSEVTELIVSIKSLTDMKLALDAEIATYRRLLMAESGREYQSISSEQFLAMQNSMQSSSTMSSTQMSASQMSSQSSAQMSAQMAAQAASQMSSTTTTTTTTRVVVNPFIQDNQEEEEYYALAFKYCDADNSGHVTTTEMKNAFTWMNENNFGGRSQRNVSYPYVNQILKMADIDSSLTLEYPEFIRLMKIEKRLFAEEAFSKFDKLRTSAVAMDQIVDVLRGAGFTYSEDWKPFLQQFDKGNGTIDYNAVLRQIR